MVREERGPYGDPQHPYFYEDDDVWMAPGFINQFYEVSYHQLFKTDKKFHVTKNESKSIYLISQEID